MNTSLVWKLYYHFVISEIQNLIVVELQVRNLPPIYIFRQGFRVGVVCMYYPLAKNVIYHILHFQYWILVMATILKPLGLHWVTSDLLTSAVLYLTNCPNISRSLCQTWTHAWYHVKINHLLARWWWCLPCTRQTCWDGNFIWAVLHIKVARSISMLQRVVLTFLQVFMIFDDTIGIVNQPLTRTSVSSSSYMDN